MKEEKIQKTGSNYNFLDSKIKTIAYIIRAARFKKGMPQAKLADDIGITQGYLSKLENAEISPPLLVWLDICDALGINEDSVRFGYISSEIPTHITSEKLNSGLKFKNKAYLKNRCLNVKNLIPVLSNLVTRIGIPDFEKEMTEKFIHPSYFIDLDNLVSLKFLDDLMDYRPKKSFSEKDFQNYYYSLMHGNSENRILIDSIFENYANSQDAFQIKTVKTKNKIDFTVKVNPSVMDELNSCREETVDYLEDISFKSIPSMMMARNFNAKLKSSGTFKKQQDIHGSISF